MQRPKSPARHKAFTLAELLIVVVIIGLLALMLFPTIGAVIQKYYAMKTKTWVMSFNGGAQQYKIDNQFYPGQEDMDAWDPVAAGEPVTYTGSQVLAAHMFGYEYTDIGTATIINPKSLYAPYDPKMLGEREGKPYTLVDGFPTPRAICYFPAAEGLGRAQYRFDHNSVYLQEITTSAIFQQYYLRETRIEADTSEAARTGDFFILAAGADRIFKTDDDITNW